MTACMPRAFPFPVGHWGRGMLASRARTRFQQGTERMILRRGCDSALYLSSRPPHAEPYRRNFRNRKRLIRFE
jgi:hypothetical protein